MSTRRVGRTRLVSANTDSPYFVALRQLLVAAFGVPGRLRAALVGLGGIEEVQIFGSCTARWYGESGARPVGDIDVLVQIRAPGWLTSGTGTFHDTVTARPMLKVLPVDGHDTIDDALRTARPASVVLGYLG